MLMLCNRHIILSDNHHQSLPVSLLHFQNTDMQKNAIFVGASLTFARKENIANTLKYGA
jgi:hypothetical protein